MFRRALCRILCVFALFSLRFFQFHLFYGRMKDLIYGIWLRARHPVRESMYFELVSKLVRVGSSLQWVAFLHCFREIAVKWQNKFFFVTLVSSTYNCTSSRSVLMLPTLHFSTSFVFVYQQSNLEIRWYLKVRNIRSMLLNF